MKQVLSKYNDFKQNIASSTKGNNYALAMAMAIAIAIAMAGAGAGAGNLNVSGSTSDKRNPLTLLNYVKSALKKQQGWKIK